MTTSTISTVIAGDASIDWFEGTTGSKQARMAAKGEVPNWKTYPLTHQWVKPGGSLLLARFLSENPRHQVISYRVKRLNQIPPTRIIRSFANLAALPYSNTQKRARPVYRIQNYFGFDGPAEGTTPPLSIEKDDPGAKMVILDDSDNGFNEAESAWPKAIGENGKPTILYKMSWPFASGKLWQHLLSHHSKRLIAIVGVNDLRLEGVHISRRLSWERTVADFFWQLEHHESMARLKECAFLVVRFGVEGAILVDNSEGGKKLYLFYDPEIGEDGFAEIYPGIMCGVGTVFTASLASSLLNPERETICQGIHQGLLGARELWKQGFGSDFESIDYNYDLINQSFEQHDSIQEIAVTRPKSGVGSLTDNWSLLDDLAQAGLEQAAAYFVVHGKDPALDRVPIARYRYLRAIDRTEIESYRSIHNLIQEYLATPKNNKPLAIAVFGPPGSGKSFGVTEVAESISAGSLEKMEFNLSQFRSLQDLLSAFHKIRDISLSGTIPLVFFDEFDASFNGELGWLKYFLAPIQDGEFREGEAIHPIGKAIFVFAGGTSHTFEQFSNCDADENSTDEDKEFFKKVKGPDFVSRLRGFINVKGPNPVDDKDDFYMIRRALLLRHLLTSKARHLLGPDKTFAIDRGVLRALLRVRRYKHGVRSMVALIEMSLLANRNSFEPAALPSKKQMELHVDAIAFYDLVLRDAWLSSQIEKIAQALHEQYRHDQKDRKPATDPAMQPWDALDEKLKASNRDAAADIPAKLKAIGYDFEKSREKVTPISFSKDEIQKLGRMEHERYNRERLAAGWTPGPRNVEKKQSPYLVSWDRLPDDVKEWDLEAVKDIPGVMADAGFRLYKTRKK